jgi:predicted ATPase/class 3 adenylate cyclase
VTERAPARPVLTYLFSDVVGSTALWERERDAMERDLAQHDALMTDALERAGGRVFKTAGDAYYAAFAAPTDALRAGLDAQMLLQRETWTVSDGIRVRMAIHTGESEARRGDYFGPALNKTARLLALADGGHVLVSDATAALVAGGDWPLHDHGARMLKGIAAPVHVYQLVYDAPLGSVIALTESAQLPPTNLPPAIALVGRDAVVATLVDRAATSGVLTIAGLGGVGKSALALAVAHALRPRFAHGTWWIDLAQITDPAIVALQLDAALGPHATEALVVLDNAETLLGAAAEAVAALRAARPHVCAIVTTREPMHVAGETVWRLDPLATNDGVDLLVERIRAREPQFTLDAEEAEAARRIVDALDGLPLALELAAARTGAVSLDEVARRLDDRFRFLKSSGAARRPLREIVAWSFDGLAENERRFIRRLAVFPGTWSLDAAEAICGDPDGDDDVLDLLGSAVEKSLVQALPDGKRYRFLQTIRAYARDLAVDDPRTAGELADAHAAYFAELTRSLEADDARVRARAVERVAGERENVRAALLRLTEMRDPDALRVAVALRGWWIERGNPNEGRLLLTRALDASDLPEDAPLRVRARLARATVATYVGEFESALRESLAVLEIARASGDGSLIADALNAAAVAVTHRGDGDAAGAYYRESAEVSAASGYRAGEARALYNLGAAAANAGDAATARERYEQSLALFRALRDRWRMAWVLTGLARLAFEAERYAEAQTEVVEALEVRRTLDDRRGIVESLALGAEIALARDDAAQGSAFLRELFGDAWSPDYVTETAMALLAAARWMAFRGAERLAANIVGFREAFVENTGSRLIATPAAERLEMALRERLGTGAFEAECSNGSLTELETLVREVRASLA